MSANKIVVIGGVATGPKAAARARRCDPKAEITIIEKGDFLSYAGCGMPFYIGGIVKEPNDLMSSPIGVVRDASFFKSVKDINVLTRTKAETIDCSAKTVEVIELSSGEKKKIPYDKLVLATGSNANRPPIPGINLSNVYTLGNMNDAIAIKQALLKAEVNKMVLVGAGLISLELAHAIQELKPGMDITIVELMEYLMPAQLDPEIAALVGKHLKQKGIKLLTSQKVSGFEGQGQVQKVNTVTDTLDADLVVVSAGARPEVELAVKAGIKLGPTGAIAVNEYMQTSDPDIYAGGDCAENVHFVTKKPVYIPMGSTANRHGRVIGDNVTGGKDTFPGVLGTTIVKVFDFNVGRTGISETEAKKLGYGVTTFICPNPDRAHFYPGHNLIVIKLIADSKTRKLVGAQIVGTGDVNKRLDVAVTAISMGTTVDQLANFDLAYAPPFATAMDAMTHAANSLRNKLDGRAKSISSLQVKEKLDRGEDFILLDVRSPKEYEEARLPYANVKLIPLGKLRERLGELPKDKEIVTFCKLSMRGYEAQGILEGEGFTNVKFFEGGIATWPFEVDTEKFKEVKTNA